MSGVALDDDEYIDEGQDGALTDGDLGEVEQPITVEDRAKAMGWKPLPADPGRPQPHEYRGDPRRWTDAETFIAHGEEELPILRDQTRRMSEKLARLERTAAEQTKAIRDAMALAKRADEAGYQRGLKELKDQQRQAVAEGDTVAFDQVQAQIDAAQAARERAVVVEEPPPPAPAQPEPEGMWPETRAFLDANPWFNRDPTLNAAMIAAHQAVLRLHPNLSRAEQYDRAKQQVVDAYPDSFPDEAPAMTAPRTPAPAARPRANGVLPPSREVPRQRAQDPFMRIENPAERDEARKAFQSISKYDPDTTAEDYIKLYFKEANVLDLRANRNRK